MNDPIKKFVQEHREDFDHREPAADVLLRLRAQLRPTPVVKKGFFQRHQRARWLVAASLLLGLVCTYLLMDRRPGALPDDMVPMAQQTTKPAAAPPATDTPAQGSAHEQRPAAAPISPNIQPAETASRYAAAPKPAAAPVRTLATRLADSSSASIRLAAILEVEQAGQMDGLLAAMLAQTMNHDANTNVRLAALDVLSQYLHEPHVAGVFTQSLATQDDLLVQLALVKIAGQIDNRTVEETLFALVSSPYTFDAVKDEAYAVLLKQNKL